MVACDEGCRRVGKFRSSCSVELRWTDADKSYARSVWEEIKSGAEFDLPSRDGARTTFELKRGAEGRNSDREVQRYVPQLLQEKLQAALNERRRRAER